MKERKMKLNKLTIYKLANFMLQWSLINDLFNQKQKRLSFGRERAIKRQA